MMKVAKMRPDTRSRRPDRRSYEVERAKRLAQTGATFWLVYLTSILIGWVM